ncbi:LysR family transcriptional regulator [Nocardia grenadensis]|uniref:LysR family transcriptional regulator n=1 Tax=Nocardia grenadensis TaxID=931537 RepID=UPI003D752BC4
MSGNYDFATIRAFVEVYRARSVTVAAENLFVSQPTVSYALGKMRRRFGDELFFRRDQQLVPTPVADTLYPQLRDLLERLDAVMSSAAEFDPATTTRTFRITLSDVGITGLLPKALAKFAAAAPHAQLVVHPLQLSRSVEELRTGTTDAVVCTPVLDGDDLTRIPLFTQPYIGVCRADNRRIGDTPTLEEFEDERHVTVIAEAGHTAVDARVRELGIRREVALTLPSFTGLAAAVAAGDLLGFAPRIYAERSQRFGEVRLFGLPFEVPRSTVSLYTVHRALPSPEIDWLRSLLIETLGDAAAIPGSERR